MTSTEIDRFKDKFGPQAANYTKYRTAYPDALFALLSKELPDGAQKILDLACGTGKSTEELVKTGCEIVGVDHDELMIEEAKRQAGLKHLEIEYRVGSAEHIPFDDQSFDVVTIGTAFHFFQNESALAEIKRVLKSDGLIFIYWTLVTKEIPEEDEIPGALYRKYGWLKIPPELRSIDHVVNVLRVGGFKNVNSQVLPITIQMGLEERIGLQTTSGTFELLSQADQEKFLTELRAVLTAKLGTRTHFSLEEEIQVCWACI